MARAEAAVAAHRAGRRDEAETLYRQVVSQMEHPVVLAGFGALLVETGRAAEAEGHLRRAFEIARDKSGPALNLGAALRDMGRSAEAARVDRKALALDPANPRAFVNLGVASTDLREFTTADAAFVRAGVLDGAFVDSHLNAALAARNRNDLETAVRRLRRAAALAPASPTIMEEAARLLADLQRLDEATVLRRRLFALRPDDEARYWLGFTLIAAGRGREGWPLYRDGHRHLSYPDIAKRGRGWDGCPVSRLLVFGDQGFGDAILHARFLPDLFDRASEITLAVRSPLVRLLRERGAGRVRVISINDDPGPIDAWVPLSTAPAFTDRAMDRIDGAPYLRRLTPARSDALHRPPHVGLVWAGNPGYARDRLRSPGFDAVRPLLDVPGVNWVLLQVGAGRDQARGRVPPGVVDLGDRLTDFEETARVLEGLDLFVSSDTGTAHLAGALGVPTLLLAPALADWRWTVDETGRSLWYGSVRVIRQPRLGDWGAVVATVSRHLKSRFRTLETA